MEITVNVHHHIHLDDCGIGEISGRITGIETALSALVKQGTIIMATVKQILDSEDHTNTALGQLATAVQQLKTGQATLEQELRDALANATIPADVQTDIDNAFAKSSANSASVDSILTSLAPIPAPGPVAGDPGTGTGNAP